jgi:DNA gyrase subunit A
MLLTLTEKGYGKRTPTQEYLVTSEDGSTRVQSRGGKGRKDVEVTDKNGRVVAVRTVEPGEEILLLSAGGQAIRTRADEVRLTHRGSQGVRVMNLDEGDKLVAVASIAGGEETQVAETPAAE